MVESTARTRPTSGFALVLLVVTTLIMLFGIVFASVGFDEVADASPFGRAGTVTAAGVVASIAVIAAVVAWRGAGGAVRVGFAVAVFLAVGLVAVMALFFLIAGGTAVVLVVLLVLAAITLGMIGRAVLQIPAQSGR